MRLFPQLVISLITAAIVTAVVIQFQLSSPLQLGIAIAIATCTLPLLGAIFRRSRAVHLDESDREEGLVKWFNVSKGFGFIRRENGEEIFVHFRSIRGKDNGRKSLRDGQHVSYIVVDSDKGPQAEEVEAL